MLAAIFLVGLVYVWRALPPGSEPTSNREVTAPPSARVVSDSGAISEAFKERRSSVWVEGAGQVQRTLADDTEGSRHQRFIVDLGRGQTILIAHNIDLARRLPLERGDFVEFRGKYEWNAQGGVVHWTHADPQRHSTGGWIRYQDRKYQ
jgi:hypothetical protein